jgi:flavin-dependent dehydrogenase
MTAPVIIAGGGLAGSAAAAGLARAGVKVILIEREAGPVDKICGEFLSIEAQHYLGKLGLNLAKLGGHEITNLTLARGDKSVETALPFRGIGISRRDLDEAVLTHAEACGANVLRGNAINRIHEDDDITLDVANIGDMHTRTLFLATGKHEMRGFRREPDSMDDLVGFKMYFRLGAAAEQALAGQIMLILFRGGYAGLQLVEGRKANLCLLVRRSRLQVAGGKWQALLDDLCDESAVLSRALSSALPLLEKPLTIFRVPYGYVYRPNATDDTQIFRLGDQAGVIPSFTGDGMAIALHSAALAVSCYLSGATAARYHERLSSGISGQISRAGRLYAFSQNSGLQAAGFALARIWPQTLRLAANVTRVPMRARL